MKKWNTKMLVEAGVMIGLAIILSKIKIYQAPSGGSVTAGSMIPIIIFSMRWGLGPGIIAGSTFGILKLMLGGWIYSPMQVILEYPIAFGFLGLAGMFSESLSTERKTNYLKIIFSVFLSIGGRFVSHLLAGVIFFGDTLPENISPWISSAIYQATYLVPEFIIAAILLSLLWKPLNRIER